MLCQSFPMKNKNLYNLKIFENFTFSIKSQIFDFHRETLIKHKSLKIWTFWACKTSFEKLVSRALRFLKNIGGVQWKNSEKNSSEERSFLDHFETPFLWKTSSKFFVFWPKLSRRAIRTHICWNFLVAIFFNFFLAETCCDKWVTGKQWLVGDSKDGVIIIV